MGDEEVDILKRELREEKIKISDQDLRRALRHTGYRVYTSAELIRNRTKWLETNALDDLTVAVRAFHRFHPSISISIGLTHTHIHSHHTGRSQRVEERILAVRSRSERTRRETDRDFSSASFLSKT
jgi:hypothetical protein